MKKLSVIFLLLCVFITGCASNVSNKTSIDNTSMHISDSIDESDIEPSSESQTENNFRETTIAEPTKAQETTKAENDIYSNIFDGVHIAYYYYLLNKINIGNSFD